MSIRIVLGNDHRLTLEALASVLNTVKDFSVVGIVCQASSIVPAVLRTMPTVAVLGHGAVGLDGMSVASELRGQAPACGVAILAVEPNRALVDHAIAAGALSVVPRHAKLTHLVDAIRGVAAGCLTIDPGLLHAPKQTCETLSYREQEILRRTVTGASVKEIAEELYLAPGTVRNLTSQAIRKLAGRNRFDAARIAGERGML